MSLTASHITDKDFSLLKRKISRVLILGDSGVGKTSLTNRFTNSGFKSIYSMTICADMKSRDFSTEENESDLVIITDIAGQSRFKEVRTLYYLGADYIFVVCDLTRKKTLEHLETIWIPEVVANLQKEDNSKFNLFLIGNKLDLEHLHVIAPEDIEEAISRIEAKYPSVSIRTPILLTSAKENMSIKLHTSDKLSELTEISKIIQSK